jgi:hypothetical protein
MSGPPDGDEPTPPPDEAPEPAASPSAPAPAEGGERPPGWYPDPDGSGWRRYWDGQRWSSASAEQLADETAGSGGRSPIVARLVVGAGVLALIIVVIVLVSGTSTHTSGTGSTAAAPPTLHASGTTTSATTTTSTTAPVAPAQIGAALNAYVSAYNARSITALGALFSPRLVRRTGNGHPENLAGALTIYRGQFAAEAHPDLVLADIHMTSGVGQASAGALFGVYAHHRRSRGTIAFHFTQSGSQLLIDQLVVRVR